MAKLGVYILAGWPNRKTFSEVLNEVSKIVDFVELGIPTADPKYDGPYIRVAHREVFPLDLEVVKSARGLENLVLMAYADSSKSPVDLLELGYRIGAISVLLPDLLVDYPELLDLYLAESEKRGLKPSFFIPSKFSHSLIRRLRDAKPYFVYLGLYAATGIRLPIYVERNIRIARELLGDVELVVGFAIDNVERARALVRAGADGVVIGTAFMKKLASDTREALEFLSEIKRGITF